MKLKLLLAGLTLALCAGGCTGKDLAAFQATTNDAALARADVKQTAAIANAVLAATSTTQPAYKALAATTQGLEKTDVLLGKALDVANAVAQASSAKSVDDPRLAVALQTINAAIPNPYTPLISLGIPLVLSIAGVVMAKAHGKTTATLASANTDLSATLATAQQDLAAAKLTIAAASLPPPR